MPVNAMIHWAVLGMLFRAVSWAIGFILLAKGASKLYFWNELIANVYMLGLNILGYMFMGLSGLGISFMIGYALHLIQMYVLSKIKYQYSFDKALSRIFTVQSLLALSCFVVIKFTEKPYSYVFGIGLIIISSWYSYNELDKRLGLFSKWNTLKKKLFLKK